MVRFLKRFAKEEDGGPAVEFAIVGAFLAVSIPAMLDLATLINSNVKLLNGMRAASQYAVKYPTNSTGIASALSNASGIPTQSLTVTTSQFCECAGITTSCASSCSAGVQMGVFDKVTAVYDMTAQYNYRQLFPQTITKDITVRTQ